MLPNLYVNITYYLLQLGQFLLRAGLLKRRAVTRLVSERQLLKGSFKGLQDRVAGLAC